MTIRERNPEPTNPLGMDGIEFIEYATSQPQALGARAAEDGLRAGRAPPLARGDALSPGPDEPDRQRASRTPCPALPRRQRRRSSSAIALRVRDAAHAYRHALDLGAWEMPTRASAMELNIPGIHGVGDSLHLLRRPLQGLLDLRRRFRAAARRRAQPAGDRRAALLRHRAERSATSAARDWIDFYQQPASASRCCPAASTSASCPRARCSRARATSSTCS